MGSVRIAHHFPDLTDFQFRVSQQLLGLLNANGIKDIIEALLRIPVQQLGQVPLGYIAAVRHGLKCQLLVVVLLHEAQGLIDDEAAGVLVLLFLFLHGLLFVQALHHRGQRLFDFLHFGGLQQKTGHPQADGLLGIGKIPVAGEDGHLHIRVFASQRRHHGQPVPAGHPDVRKQDIRVQLPDETGPLFRIAGGAHHLTVVVRPTDHPAQALHNDVLVIDQHYPIHGFPLLFYPFSRMADSTASAAVICPVTTL